ncbi:penicillin-binding protein 1A [Herminiimonas fonticola]|uniref:Penicillin-binding protein 1A n=1 Tax=Herminiimonas fonticola TaxID=303380 RepID=A0A4R6G3N6_9BURK|nr:penicillin-binding protein, 1A family [Herminiimonas fonticola]TDN88214.1 penicillin-binding protein 1A [Herminiimonas fonticola]
MRLFSIIKKSIVDWSERPTDIKLRQAGIVALIGAGAFALLMALFTVVFIVPNLPSIDALTDYRPKIPLRVYTADNVLIGEFGEERRDFVSIGGIPSSMKNAIIAIEDNNFYEHGGVDILGVVRAGLANLIHSRSQGASTITMQVARTFLLTRKKTYSRKLQEVLLAYRIEKNLTKDQILELYMNQIYLGQRAYGFGSASRIYFGKPIKDLTIAESAMLAGLPKAPASANPVVNPKRATERQQYILKRMHELGFITQEQYEKAKAEKLNVLADGNRFRTHAEYAAEQVRQFMYTQYKDEIYTSGMSVYTTLNKADQDAAYEAVRRGVLDYDKRHGYRGPEDNIDLPKDEEDRQQAIEDILVKHPDSDDLKAAVVTAASAKSVRAETLSGEDIEITGDGLRFAASGLASKAAEGKKIKPGSVIRVVQDSKKKWAIVQLPEVSAAFVSVNAQDGGIRAMVGGFDFALNQFDHVTQAWRQPGSTIKPFVYSAALEKGLSPGTLINDAPLAEDNTEQNGKAWNPGNDNGQYDGPVTMRTGLKRSKNLVSIRILRKITPPFAIEHMAHFGLDADKQPSNLTLALGTGSVTPLQMAGAYAVFANGGFKLAPYLIQKVVDVRGKVLLEADHPQAGDETARAIDPRNAFIMNTMLRDVVRSGTGYMAGQRLGRSDLAGKTGTTNDSMDGWFAGYGRDVVGVAWMGYDKPRTLGGREFGSTLALPIWVDYMRTALRGKPEIENAVPPGVAQVDGDWTYEEYVNGDSVKSVDVEEQKGFWEKLFNPGDASQPQVPGNVNPDEKPKDIYGG